MDSIVKQNKKGATLIEIIIVIAIIGILGAMVSPFVSNMIIRSNFDTTVDQVIGTIRKAQAYSMDGKNNEDWGVCVSGNAIRLFSGTCATPTFDEDYEIPSTVTVAGFSETTFSHLRGEPTAAMSITISTNEEDQVITVNQGGGMEIN